MVKVETSEAKPETARLFLNSIKSWYNDTGIKVAVESVGKPFGDDEDDKRTIAVGLVIMDGMPRCRVRKVKDGKLVTMEDEEGNEKPEIEIVGWVEEVTVYCKCKVEDEENDEYKVFSLHSSYPLFNFAFIEHGDLPANNKKNIIFSYEELVEVLEGLEFMATTETREFGGNKYPVLIPKAIE